VDLWYEDGGASSEGSYKGVTHFVDGTAERDVPLQVFHFDCF
jgi:hypothetical protein